MTTDVIIYEAYEEERIAIKKYLSDGIKARFYGGTIQECGHKRPPAGFISIRTQSRIPKDWNTISAVLTRSQGYDHMLEFSRAASFRGRAGCLGSYCATSVAEQAVMGMLMLMRKGKQQMDHFREFNRDGLTGHECRGKNAGVIGVGNIGREIVRIAKGLGMHVKGVDLIKKLKTLEYVSLASAIRWSDALFCALPLTGKTQGLLGYQSLKMSRRGLYFINISRGEIAPTGELIRLLNEKKLKGLALDVFQGEAELAVHLRKRSRSPVRKVKIALDMAKRDNVILTPHNAFNTVEALDENARRSARSIEMYIRKGCFPYPVELP